MPWVRMIVAVSGGRPDGSVWPNPWVTDGLIEVSDDEARDLIYGAQIAVHAQPPVKPADEPVKSVAVLAPPEPEPEPEPELAAPAAETVEHLEPLPSDSKPAWVEWAVHQGADRDEAMAMTKPQLQAKYGGRL